MNVFSRLHKPYYYLIPSLIIFLICVSTQSHGQSASDPIHEGSIELEKLNNQDAKLLAPRAFSIAVEEYQRYVNLIRSSRPSNEAEASYEQFKQSIHQTKSLMNQTRNILSKALSARDQARNANAPSIADKEYQDAENTLKNAIEKLEDNKLSESDKLGQEAVLLYRNVEIMALKVGLIGKVKALISEAKDNKAHEFTPNTYNFAVRLINEIEQAIDQGHGLTPEIRQKASKAEYEAEHALYLSRKIATLRRDNNNWERILLNQEEVLSNLAEVLKKPYHFDLPGDSLIMTTQQRLTVYEDSLRTSIVVRDTEINRLTVQIDSLKQDYKTQQIRLASRIEEYQSDLQSRKEELERRRRELDVDLHKKMILDAVQQAQTRFEKNEALIFRESDEIVLRLVGLAFASSKTTIPAKAFPLLDKLSELIELYPDADILIEGHTDSSGKEDKNLQYSETRAASVRAYLLKTKNISEARIKAQGFGSSRPIATNKSRLGRTRNRRIDVIIDFANVETIGAR